MVFIRAVTAEASVREDRADVPIELQRGVRGGCKGGSAEPEADKCGDAREVEPLVGAAGTSVGNCHHGIA
jgi:hypothetical protein